MLADVEIEPQSKRDVRLHGCVGQLHRCALVVHDRREADLRKRANELGQPSNIRADRLICQEYVGGALARHHLGFGDGGAFESPNAERKVRIDQRRQLVRLHVRPQSLDVARDGDHPPQVLRGTIGIDEQGRRRNAGDLEDGPPGGRHVSQFRRSLRSRRRSRWAAR
jgi:hypothetical protein